MSWAKFDDQYPDHPKIVEVGPLGMALHLAATCYCARYLTDGFVATAMIPRLLNLDGIYRISNAVSNAVTHKEITDELTRVGLFEVVPGGFMVHDYLKYNPPAAKVKQEREESAARQASWKAAHPKKDKNARSNGVSNANSNALLRPSRTRTPLPVPEPVPEPKENTAPLQAQSLYPIAKVLSEVTGINLDKNKGRIFKEAKTYKPEDVQKIQGDYSQGGPWYSCDWRGQKGQPPTLAQIRETWGNLKAPIPRKNGTGNLPIPQETPEERARLDDIFAKVGSPKVGG
jgi:hypothetical protein